MMTMPDFLTQFLLKRKNLEFLELNTRVSKNIFDPIKFSCIALVDRLTRNYANSPCKKEICRKKKFKNMTVMFRGTPCQADV